MAKKSKIAKNEQRKVIAARYVEQRRALKAVIASPRSSSGEKADAVVALQRMPRDASATRIRNRDTADGRPRGYLRKFGLSRVRMRQMAHNGELPGVSKSSW
ncbi:30S ribosomal protein S14 [Amycolatopsis rhabdoformis]|uniref:Small ribosomal subunit protein uS14 n=1 Tax=Amycolatopsis rhabdoformis TaxID=1448059 RepID=A0ABZ1IIB1_9PSEU|nr:30S ribosomal protein S14 [Amycolatopsis rhabdoformis]WSE33160.1 30S ribosomal protein S14 [Amycolatopsis rhabdoformis]